MDHLSPQQRSKNMAAIHSKNTKPEMIVRKGLNAQQNRLSVHYGLTLDLVNPAFLREKAGVFCNKAALLDDKGGLRLISCQCCDFCQQSLCF